MTREEAIEILNTYDMSEDNDDTEFKGAIALAIKALEKEPKTGHWSHDGSHWENRWICSECGYKLFDEQTKYCPNCGAKMEG